MLEGEAEALTRKAIDMAMNGDVVSLRLCLERAAPCARGGLLLLIFHRLIRRKT
jgi:hypothetical protein